MPMPRNAQQVLDREFLEIRAKTLELAAALDRLDRAAGDVALDARVQQLEQALQVLQQRSRTDRAEAVQRIFSREYDEAWQRRFGLPIG